MHEATQDVLEKLVEERDRYRAALVRISTWLPNARDKTETIMNLQETAHEALAERATEDKK